MNTAVVSTTGKIFYQVVTFLPWVYSPKGCHWGSMFNFLRCPYTAFHNGCANVCSHQLWSPNNLPLVLVRATLTGVRRHLWVLICISLKMSDSPRKPPPLISRGHFYYLEKLLSSTWVLLTYFIIRLSVLLLPSVFRLSEVTCELFILILTPYR